jgi:quinolinate synthase
VNQVTVDEDTTRWARVALERMLELRGGPQGAAASLD